MMTTNGKKMRKELYASAKRVDGEKERGRKRMTKKKATKLKMKQKIAIKYTNNKK